MRTTSSISLILFSTILLFSACQEIEEVPELHTLYPNIHSNIEYAGMETCITCHLNVHQSYQHTGMGLSFENASLQKTSATFNEHSLVYDSSHNLYYFPFFKDSSFFVKEFRMDGKDTVHQRIEEIDYIIGSGHHTNSHLIDINGYLFQAPVTFYTQDEQWDMAPGFRGSKDRFDRFLTEECISCHNHLPDFDSRSINKFNAMPQGIECERCHGPGAYHVREKQAGILVDTAQFIDYSILNPADLPRAYQIDLCQRCHLQGIAVLKEDKTFFDFRPGMRLQEVMHVFLPRYGDSEQKFIMASQSDRLQQSACFQKSEMTCLTCHNPHHTVKSVKKESFNQQCIQCHQEVQCSESEQNRFAANNNCLLCHMPESGSIDIPHVRITDHFIRKVDSSKYQKTSKDFLGLKLLTKEKGSALEMAQGYLAFYDKYVQSSIMLDSAYHYLQLNELQDIATFKTWIHYYFSSENYKALIKQAESQSFEKINDAWTYYRIGEAYYKTEAFQKAEQYFESACQLKPLALQFQEKLGVTKMDLNKLAEAKSIFEFVLKENPKREVALCNLGFVHVLRGQYPLGESYYDQAIALNPDYEQALVNKAAMLLLKREKDAAKNMLERVLKLNPNNLQAKAGLGRIQ